MTGRKKHTPFQPSPRLQIAMDEITRAYGAYVSIADTRRTNRKFGRNLDIGATEETIWEAGGTETLLTTNGITHVSSSDAGDDQVMAYSGFTVTGTGVDRVFTRASGTVTLNGQTAVELPTALCRIERSYTDDATPLAGTVYFHEGGTLSGGVPNDAAEIHLTVGSANQSYKCQFSTPDKSYFIVTELYVGVRRSQTANVDWQLLVAEAGKVFREKESGNSSNSSGFPYQLDPCIIIPPNADALLQAISSANNTGVNGRICGYFANVIE